jgi:hypothetical protein
VTLNTLIASDVSDVLLNTSEFAETVTRLIAGNTGDTEAQTAVVHEIGSAFRNREGAEGEFTQHTVALQMASTNTVNTEDAYLVAGERVDVQHIERAAESLLTVYCVRRESRITETRAIG